ncbi:hypothetical protein M8J76_000242 [Diaphorina citri]|nr:hypothetical protein M8J76_000242 [Diaphorina citri]
MVPSIGSLFIVLGSSIFLAELYAHPYITDIYVIDHYLENVTVCKENTQPTCTNFSLEQAKQVCDEKHHVKKVYNATCSSKNHFTNETFPTCTIQAEMEESPYSAYIDCWNEEVGYLDCSCYVYKLA